MWAEGKGGGSWLTGLQVVSIYMHGVSKNVSTKHVTAYLLYDNLSTNCPMAITLVHLLLSLQAIELGFHFGLARLVGRPTSDRKIASSTPGRCIAG